MNSETPTPSTLVLTAVITVPVVSASPVLMDELPLLNEVELLPVVVAPLRLEITDALLF